ncbi:type II toxin-antitoxin system PemK/MazF family toxin [Patescibacteria group bacterium]
MKDFDNWNSKKKKIESTHKAQTLRKKQIWWASLGLNIGYEQDGKNENFERPVLIVKTFGGETFLGIPITSVNKENKKFYFPIHYNGEVYYLILSQIRLFSTKRLLRNIGKMESGEFANMKIALKKVIGLP